MNFCLIIHIFQKSHFCKATQKEKKLIRFRLGPCVSQKQYKPKFCSSCPGKCCYVTQASTILVHFVCPLDVTPELIKLTGVNKDSYLSQNNGNNTTLNSHIQNIWMKINSNYKNFHPDFTSADNALLLFIKMTDYKIIKRNVQMNMRCRCSKTCP